MSTADGLVISSAQVFANDLYRRTLAKRWSPELDGEQLDRRVLVVSRWATVGVLAVSAGVAWLLLDVNIALLVWMGIGGMTSSLAGPLLLGSLWNGVSERGALSGMLTGFITFAVLAVGYLKATGSEALVARAFAGREGRMILMAALLGGMSPFCSCEVIPFIAALLAVGAPLSAVMAFWLASPLMDPAMFLITAGTLGMDFAIAKTAAAVGLGLLGGATVYLFANTSVFADPLRPQPTQKGCGCGPSPFSGDVEWRFWGDAGRRTIFKDTVVENALFLGKWLLLAYMLEALMLAYVPTE